MLMTRPKLMGALAVSCLAVAGAGPPAHGDRPAAAPGAEKPGPPPGEGPGLPASFTRLLTLIKPRADESQLEQVPWAATLWEARLKAAAEGKPIFIWVTGGPPGGC
jgi:hypothetical protein